MTRGEAWFAHAATLLVGGSGVVYGWMAYFAVPTDEFAVVNHPWQPEALHAHVLFAPLLVFSCGQLWRDHVWRRVRGGYPVHRRTGLLLFGVLAPMILSGVLVQVAEGELVHRASVWVHVSTSVAWIVGYLAHQLAQQLGSRAARRERAAATRDD